MDLREIESLIKLLDDPDANVYQAIRVKLNQMGAQVIPHLEKAWENSLDDQFQNRIEDIIQDIHHAGIKTKLINWEKGSHDLIEGAILIANFQFPDLDIAEIQKTVDKIKQDVWIEINENLTALEKIKIVNHIFFDVYGFSRSNSFHNNSQSNFINHLLETKKGSPLTLAILYSGICQKLNIPVSGVALPKNFILCYKDSLLPAFYDDINQGVLFYINPFNKGVIFGKKEIELFIKQQKLENKKTYFQPCSNKETIIYLLNTLVDLFENMGDKIKANNYRSLIKILYI